MANCVDNFWQGYLQINYEHMLKREGTIEILISDYICSQYMLFL